jgi:hypothetical protein
LRDIGHVTTASASPRPPLTGLPLPDAGKRATYYDETVPKLALRVTAAGTKTFYIVKRVGTGMAWLKLGVFPDMTVELARKEAENKLGLFAGGDNPAETRRALKAEPTLAEFFKEYGTRHGQRKKAWRDDQATLSGLPRKATGREEAIGHYAGIHRAHPVRYGTRRKVRGDRQ